MASNEDYANARRTKESIHAPCSYMGWNEALLRDEKFWPAVDCEYKCDSCGWNPIVASRRKEKIRKEIRRRKVRKSPRKRVS